MQLLNRVKSSLAFRYRRYRLGLASQSAAGQLRSCIAGQSLLVSWPATEHDVLVHEFYKIHLSDCYGLGRFAPDEIGTVLDIGANVGIFSLAARNRFRNASIHCYEPNPDLQTYLANNVGSLEIVPWFEAVGRESGNVSIMAKENSLHSRTTNDGAGSVPMVSIRTAIDRLGGRIDLLKLDCEGAEWEILEDLDALKSVKHMTLEYHLWARPGSTIGDFKNRLSNARFQIHEIQESACGSFGLMTASSIDRK